MNRILLVLSFIFSFASQCQSYDGSDDELEKNEHRPIVIREMNDDEGMVEEDQIILDQPVEKKKRGSWLPQLRSVTFFSKQDIVKFMRKMRGYRKSDQEEENFFTQLPLTVMSRLFKFLTPHDIENLKALNKPTRLFIEEMKENLAYYRTLKCINELRKLSEQEDVFDSYLKAYPDLATYRNSHELFLKRLRQSGLKEMFNQAFIKSDACMRINPFLILGSGDERRGKQAWYRGAIDDGLVVLPMAVMVQLQGITSLTIYKASLMGLPENFLKGLPNLVDLRVTHTNLFEVPQGVMSLTSLTSLDLSNNKITELPDVFTPLKKLKVINLRNNKIKRFPKVDLKVFAHYDQVDFYGNDWDERSFENIKEIERTIEEAVKKTCFISYLWYPLDFIAQYTSVNFSYHI